MVLTRGALISDGKLQAFYTEQIEKESISRGLWLKKHEKLLQARKERDGLVTRPSTAKLVERIRSLRGPALPAPIAHSKKSFVTVYKKIDEATLSQKLSEFNMHAPPKQTKDALYQGISHFGEGRAKYLSKRSQTAPEFKWTYPQTSSQELGWRLSDNVKSYQTPKFGRGSIVRDTFYRTTGALGGTPGNSRY